MRYLSVCSGIEAASVAWHHLSWTPVAFSEIEPFPSAVLAHRFPDIPNFGDMTKHEQWRIERGSVDILVGGTPCQSFSVAGLRKGLADPRGNLMLTFLAIAARLRPRWLVWENVPGVLSSGGGRDFGSFLGALGELGYGYAYRVLDAQFVRVGRWSRAVPQRRRRVFVVGCLGDWTAAAEVLALGESVQRHLEASGKARKGIAADAEGGARGGGIFTSHGVAPCLETTSNDYSRADGFTMVAQPTEVSGTIAARFGQSRNNHEECVVQPTTAWPADCAGTLAQSSTGSGAPGYSNQEIFSQNCANLVPQPVPIQDGRKIEKRQNGLGIGQAGDPAYTVDTTAAQAVAQPVPYDLYQITAPVNRQNRKPGDPCHTLARDNAAHAAVAFQQNQVGEVRCNTVAGTVNTNSNASGRNTPMVAIGTDCYNGAITGDVAATMGTPGSSVNASRPTVMQAVAIQGNLVGRDAGGPHGVGASTDGAMYTLTKADTHAVAFPINTMTMGGRPDPTNDSRMTMGVGANGDPQFTLSKAHNHAVAFHPLQDPISSTDGSTHCIGTGSSRGDATIAVAHCLRERFDAGEDGTGRGTPLVPVAPSLTATNDPSRSPQSSEVTQQVAAVHASTMTVRRLTPRECERLQGFPDDWTLIPWRGKPAEECPDGPRYKALGNSMACNCMAWIGERINAKEKQ